LAELGLVGVAVPTNDFEVQIPRSFQLTDPMKNEALGPLVAPAWQDEEGVLFFLWKEIPGLPFPSEANFAGCRVVAANEVIAAKPAAHLGTVPEATNEQYGFTCRLRRRFLTVDHGPVTTWSTEGHEAARTTAKKFALDLYGVVRQGRGWVRRHVLEMIVRGLRVSPPHAVAIVWSALLDHHSEVTGEPPMLPSGHRHVDLMQEPVVRDYLRGMY